MLTTTICAALSAAGLAVAFLTAYRRRFVAATRIAALALLPIGLAMAGLVDLFGKIGGAVATWASGLVLRPTVWAGFAVLAVAVVLHVVARIAEGRSGGRVSRRERKAAVRAGRPAVDPGASVPAVSGGSGRREQHPTAGGTGTGADDFSDIEAILKKHGI